MVSLAHGSLNAAVLIECADTVTGFGIYEYQHKETKAWHLNAMTACCGCSFIVTDKRKRGGLVVIECVGCDTDHTMSRELASKENVLRLKRTTTATTIHDWVAHWTGIDAADLHIHFDTTLMR